MPSLAYILIVSFTLMFSGCMNVASTSAQLAYHRRDVTRNVQDNVITYRAYRVLTTAKRADFHAANVTLATLNGNVLLAGQVSTEEQALKIKDTIENIQGVKRVYNFLTLQEITSPLEQIKDSWLTAKIKAKLMASNELDASQIKVVTENSTVYLMGTLPTNEADAAAQLASDTEGVNKVVKIFRYIQYLG